MRTFVIGDIHGNISELRNVLKHIDYNNDRLITLGDIVDGGDYSFDCVEELLRVKNRIDIRGNHDDWFLTFIETGIHPDKWSQGGFKTYESYIKGTGVKNLNPIDIPDTHKEFFRKQVRYYEDEDKNIFVHGGFDRNEHPKSQRARVLMWDRSLWYKAMSTTQGKLNFGFDVNMVFLGHTTTLAWNIYTPIKSANVWNIDTGAGGKLTLMDVKTEEYWQ